MKPDELIEHDVYDGLQIRYQAAPQLKRIMAYIIDVGVASALVYVVVLIGALLIFPAGVLANLTGIAEQLGEKSIYVLIPLIVLAVLVLFGIYHFYFIYFEYKTGQTPGKKIFGLSVISLDGKKLSFSQCLFRDLMRYIDCALILPGLISIYLSKRGQRLGDMAAGTLVTYSKSLEESSQFLYITREDYLMVLPHASVTNLTADQAKGFLSFAYPSFILSQKPPSTEELEHWQSFAENVIRFGENITLSKSDRLLFLAEYCNQSIKENRF